MKLIRLYANRLFHNIKFSETGLNVILGKITNKNIKEKDTHNLGKTLLCDLIDFMLLKKIKNKNDFFLTKYEIFSGCFFFLEILLDNNTYLLIRRSVDESSKINFRESITQLESFDIEVHEWTYKDIPFEKARTLLNGYLNFGVLSEFSYRKYINYFLRHQADYAEVFHLSKYKGKDFLWKEFLVELLGYDNTLLQEKKKIEDQIKSKKEEINFLSNRVLASDGDKDSTMALIELKTQELTEKQNLIDKFDFSKEDSEEHKKLVEIIDSKLDTENTRYYELKRDIEKISTSLNAEIKQINIENLKAVFEETKIAFPDEVYIQFKDLLEFNKKLSVERNKFLKEQLQEMKTELPKIEKNIADLQSERTNALAFLTKTDSYDKYKEVQNKISNLQAQISALKSQYDKINGYQSEIQNLREEITKLNAELNNVISDTANMLQEAKHAYIRNIFNQIIKNVLNVNGIISLNLNNNGNIDFAAKIQNPETLNITSKDGGSTYRKLLCIAFDLSLLINYCNSKFFKFAYHDGALEALDDRKKIAFINESRNICNKYGLQHIITLIDSDLPHNADGSVFNFSQEEICLILSDKDVSDKLFTIDF